METQNVASFSVRDFFHVLFKRKYQMMIFFCTVVGLVTLGTLGMTPIYEATSQILVKVGRENLYVPTIPTAGNTNPVISLNREEEINSEIQILKSWALAENTVKSIGPINIYDGLGESPDGKPSLIDVAVKKFRDNLSVKGIDRSHVIEVSFKHKDPNIAAMVVDKFVNLYLDRHLQVHKSPKSYEFFQKQSEELRNVLSQAEEKLENFKKENKVSSLSEERTLLLNQVASHRTFLNQTLSQEAETEKRINQLRLQLAATPKTIPQGEDSDQNTGLIGTLQAQLVDLQLKEEALLLKYTDQNRLVQSVRDEIEIVRKKLTEQESKRYGRSRTGLNATYGRLQQILYENEAELKALKAKEEIQKAQLAGYQQALAKLNRIEVEFTQLQQKVEVDQQNYRLYLTKFEESRISDAMDAEKIANVSLVEPAKPPLDPDKPKSFLNIALAVFFGIFGGLGLAFFLEYLDDRLEKIEDVEFHLQLPVLASVPDQNFKKHPVS